MSCYVWDFYNAGCSADGKKTNRNANILRFCVLEWYNNLNGIF